MASPVTITFHRMARSAAEERSAGELAHRLDSLKGSIKHCRITLESTRANAGAETRYLVKIELSLPGAQIHADSVHAEATGHTSLALALEAAYTCARNQLEKWQLQRLRA